MPWVIIHQLVINPALFALLDLFVIVQHHLQLFALLVITALDPKWNAQYVPQVLIVILHISPLFHVPSVIIVLVVHQVVLCVLQVSCVDMDIIQIQLQQLLSVQSAVIVIQLTLTLFVLLEPMALLLVDKVSNMLVQVARVDIIATLPEQSSAQEISVHPEPIVLKDPFPLFYVHQGPKVPHLAKGQFQPVKDVS